MEVLLNFVGATLGSAFAWFILLQVRSKSHPRIIMISLVGAAVAALVLPTCLCSDVWDKFFGEILYSVFFGFLWIVVLLILEKLFIKNN